MKTINLNIPDDLDEREVAMLLAAKLYEEGKLSSGQAADLVGLSKRTFIEMLGKYGVSVFSTDVNDLKKDIENVSKL